MTLTNMQTAIIVAMVVLGTVITRFFPFALFAGKKESHPYIDYLGKVLPYSAIGLLVVYCLRNVDYSNPISAVPEAVSIILIGALHYWKGNVLLSIGAGTALYMLLVQTVFS